MRRIDALTAEPARLDLTWELGLDREVADQDRRSREVSYFVHHLAGG